MALSDTVGGESRQGVTASGRELQPLIRDELSFTVPSRRAYTADATDVTLFRRRRALTAEEAI